MTNETMTIAELQAECARLESLSKNVRRVAFGYDTQLRLWIGIYGMLDRYHEPHLGHVFDSDIDKLIVKAKAMILALPDADVEWQSWFAAKEMA